MKYVTKSWRMHRKYFSASDTDIFAKTSFRHASRIQMVFSEVYEACNGDPLGMELKSKSREAWVAIMPEMSTPEDGSCRLQYFDAGSFSGHAVFKTTEDALEQAICEGYVELDIGAMDRLSITPRWAKAVEKASYKQLMEAGEISWEEMIDTFVEIDARYAA